MENITNKLDQLHLSQEKDILSKLKEGEKVVYSCTVLKINDYNKKQERDMLITNQAVYNLKSRKTIKRRIDFSQIKGVTLSIPGTAFIIHVQSEYDYSVHSPKRSEILLSILKQMNSSLSFFYKDDVDLQKFQTTKADVKKNFDRMPTCGLVTLDAQSFKEKSGGGGVGNKSMVTSNLSESQRSQNQSMRPPQFSKSMRGRLDGFNYKLVLGRGTFAKVVLVEEKSTGQLFAMKEIKKEEIIQKDQLSNTKTEKMILKHVDHPYLVNLTYALQDNTNIYFFMQFLKGGDLYQHLGASRRFTEERVQFYVSQLVLALGHLHSKNIIYRDLKLENILMDEHGNICLSDFGLAKMIRKNERSMTFCGTPDYMAPEVIKGKGADKMSDWWSLGVITYEMLHGLPPFYDSNDQVMYENIISKGIQFKESVPLSVVCQDFIRKAIEKDPSQRLGNQNDADEIMKHPWFRDIDWEQLRQKKIQPPFKPDCGGDNYLQYFDPDYRDDNPHPTKHDISYHYNSLFKYFNNDNSISYQI